MRSSYTLLLIGLLNILAGARDIRVVRSEHALVDVANTPGNAPVSANGDQMLWKSGHMKGRWRQWKRREDEASAGSEVSASSTATWDQGTSASQTTNDGAKTTTDQVSSTVEASSLVTGSSTTKENSVSSTASATGTSTESSTDASSSTTSSSISTDPGASCYSTTIKTSSSCETTGDSTTSCTTIKVTSSACSPGLLCATQTSSGTTVCMEAQNEVGTAGIVIACVFSGAILACVCTITTMCYADKRKKRIQEELRLAKSLKIAERKHLIEE